MGSGVSFLNYRRRTSSLGRVPAEYPRRSRGGAATRPHRMSTSWPRCVSTPPPDLRLVAAATARLLRLGETIIDVIFAFEAAASPQALNRVSTSRLRRRRERSAECPRRGHRNIHVTARGAAATCSHGMSTSRPHRVVSTSPPNLRLARRRRVSSRDSTSLRRHRRSVYRCRRRPLERPRRSEVRSARGRKTRCPRLFKICVASFIGEMWKSLLQKR